jgi:RimJ/RimL family protein N-acetyltransferase
MILGERIRLRAIEREDLPRFVAWLNDAEINRYLLLYLPLSNVQEEKWFENLQNRPVEEHPLVIEVKQDGGWLPVGNIGLQHLDWRNRSVEVGIFIGDKRFWNQGYGTETMRLMMKHAFNTLNLNKVYLQVFSNNPRAMKAYEKAGFVVEGRLREDMYIDGQYHDVIVMSILRSEWSGVA